MVELDLSKINHEKLEPQATPIVMDANIEETLRKALQQAQGNDLASLDPAIAN